MDDNINTLMPLKIHLNEFVTDSNNISGQWLFRKLMIGYDSDKEDTNCKVFESGDIFEESIMTNTSNNIFTSTDEIFDNKKYIFLCVSQRKECYVEPLNRALCRYFVSNGFILIYSEYAY